MVESKIKGRPSLRNFLSTGKVSFEPESVAEKKAKKDAPVKEDNASIVKKTVKSGKKSGSVKKKLKYDFSWILEKLAPDDLGTWEMIFNSDATIKEEPLDMVLLREMFRNMDRVKYTLYVLDASGNNMRTIRSGVQIREPFEFFILWDDSGSVTVYR